MGDLFAKNARNSQLHKRLKEEVEAEIRPMSYEGADLTECVARILALFAPVLAEKERAERNRDMWEGQCERQAKTLFDLRMQMLADEGQSRAGIDGWHEQIQRDASIDSPLNACCYRDQCKAMEARALAAEAALAAAKEVSRQAVMAFFDELAARGVDQGMMADAIEAAADKADAAVAEVRAAAIRAQGG